MSPGLEVFICTQCGHAVFPARSLCPRCAGDGWRIEQVFSGVVMERTVSLRRTGGSERVSIASVRSEAGPVVIARSPDDPAPGAVVELEMDGGVPVARLPATA